MTPSPKSALSLARRVMASRRAQFAVLGNGSVSIASLGLSVATARTTTIEEFGAYAMAMIVYAFATGGLRAAFTETALAHPNDPEAFGRSFRRASLVAILGGIAIFTWGLLSGNLFMGILGVALHGLVTLDTIRIFESAVGNARRAFMLGAIWSGVTLAPSMCSLFWPVSSLILFTVWAGVGATIGYVSLAIRHGPWLPGWPSNPVETRAASLFALDYAVGSGGSALTTTLLGVVVNTNVVGALRGAGTLLGPVNLIASTVRSLTIPILARAQADPVGELRTASRITIAVTLVIAPLLTAMQFIPVAWGEWLLGDTWTIAAIALLPMAIESIMGTIGSIPAAGHRAALAGKRALLLRLTVGIPRPAIVIFAATAWGIPGAAWSMAAISTVNALIWWISYRQLLRRRETK